MFTIKDKIRQQKKTTQSNVNTQSPTCSFSCWISSFFSWMSLVRLRSLCLMTGSFWLLWESCNRSADTSSLRAESIHSFLWASPWDASASVCSSLHLAQLFSYEQKEKFRCRFKSLLSEPEVAMAKKKHQEDGIVKCPKLYIFWINRFSILFLSTWRYVEFIPRSDQTYSTLQMWQVEIRLRKHWNYTHLVL